MEKRVQYKYTSDVNTEEEKTGLFKKNPKCRH